MKWRTDKPPRDGSVIVANFGIRKALVYYDDTPDYLGWTILHNNRYYSSDPDWWIHLEDLTENDTAWRTDDPPLDGEQILALFGDRMAVVLYMIQHQYKDKRGWWGYIDGVTFNLFSEDMPNKWIRLPGDQFWQRRG